MFSRLVLEISEAILEEGVVIPVLSVELDAPREIHVFSLDDIPPESEKQAGHFFTLGRTLGEEKVKQDISSLILLSEIVTQKRNARQYAIVIEHWDAHSGTSCALFSFTRHKQKITRLSHPTFFLRQSISEHIDAFLRGFATRMLSPEETDALLSWTIARKGEV